MASKSNPATNSAAMPTSTDFLAAADYIEDLAAELSIMAKKQGLKETAALLRYASLEAARKMYTD